MPVPLGRLTVPRTIWSALRGSTPSRIETSTVSSNFAADGLATSRASTGAYSLASSMFFAAASVCLAALHVWFLSPVLVGAALALPRVIGLRIARRGSINLTFDADAHGAGGALDDLHGGVDVVGVEVGELGLRDLAHLVAGELADLVPLRHARALRRPAAFLISSAAGGVLVMNVNVRSS